MVSPMAALPASGFARAAERARPAVREGPVSPASWGFDAHALTKLQSCACFSRKLLDAAVVADDLRPPRRARFSASQAVWPARAAVGEHRDLGVGQHLDLAHHAVAAAPPPVSSAPAA